MALPLLDSMKSHAPPFATPARPHALALLDSAQSRALHSINPGKSHGPAIRQFGEIPCPAIGHSSEIPRRATLQRDPEQPNQHAFACTVSSVWAGALKCPILGRTKAAGQGAHLRVVVGRPAGKLEEERGGQQQQDRGAERIACGASEGGTAGAPGVLQQQGGADAIVDCPQRACRQPDAVGTAPHTTPETLT